MFICKLNYCLTNGDGSGHVLMKRLRMSEWMMLTQYVSTFGSKNSFHDGDYRKHLNDSITTIIMRSKSEIFLHPMTDR